MQSRLLAPARPERAAPPKGPTTLGELIDRTPELPAMPTVALATHKETGRPAATAASVAALVGTDPALTVRVLRLANSAHYGASRQVATVSDAVVRLGMKSVRNLCLLAGAYPWLKGGLSAYGLGPGELLSHSLAAAVAARALAERGGLDADVAFTAGLLHDLGKVALAPWHRGTPLQGLDDERRRLGFDHAQAGGELARRWNLPQSLTGAIACHHIPCEPLEDAVHVSDALAYLVKGREAPATNLAALARCGLIPDDLPALAEGLRPDFERHLKMAEACG